MQLVEIKKAFKRHLIITRGHGEYFQRYRVVAIDVELSTVAITRVVVSKESEAFDTISSFAFDVEREGEIRNLVHQLYLKLREARPDHEYDTRETYWVTFEWFNDARIPDNFYNQLQLEKPERLKVK